MEVTTRIRMRADPDVVFALAAAVEDWPRLLPHYRRVRTRDNNYLQDRQKMKLGDHTGIPGIPNQDMAMWETMGPIADRTQERLGGLITMDCAGSRRPTGQENTCRLL